MSNKIELEEVESVLLQHKVESTPAIIEDLQKILEELQAEKEANAEEKPKYEFVVILNDPNGTLKGKKEDLENDLSAYIVQQEEGENANLIFGKIADAAKAQNETAKTKKSRLQNMRDIFEGLKSKFVKEKKLKIKTKEAVRILVSDGKML